MTFSIMKGERLIIGELLDSIVMNLGKRDSTSSSESLSLKFLLSFFYLHQLLGVFELKDPYSYCLSFIDYVPHPPWSPIRGYA